MAHTVQETGYVHLLPHGGFIAILTHYPAKNGRAPRKVAGIRILVDQTPAGAMPFTTLGAALRALHTWTSGSCLTSTPLSALQALPEARLAREPRPAEPRRAKVHADRPAPPPLGPAELRVHNTPTRPAHLRSIDDQIAAGMLTVTRVPAFKRENLSPRKK